MNVTQYSFLPFTYVGQNTDWQKDGYHKNITRALKYVPNDQLVSFRTPFITGSFTAPSTFKLRKLSILDSSVSVIDYTEQTSYLVKHEKTINSILYSYYYRQQGALTTSLTEGCLYDIFIEDSEGNQFVSDPFLAISYSIVSEAKPIKKRVGFLPFYKLGESQDWQLNGYYKNWVRSLKFVSKDSLVSFRTPNIYGGAVISAPSTMTIRKVRIVGDTITTISSSVITSDLVKASATINGVNYTYYYRLQNTLATPLEAGCIYIIYIIDTNSNEFISDLFLAIDETLSDYILTTEDGEIITTESDEYITATT
jgi:hypothetical protein